MSDKTKNMKTGYPKRKRARLKYDVGGEGVEIPVEVSCRAKGECVIRHPRMEELIFPKVVRKKGKRR